MNNVVRIDLYIAVRNLRANWKDWNIVTRAGAVAELRCVRFRCDLARIADCGAASIRRLESIDQLSPELKARIAPASDPASLSQWPRPCASCN